MSTPFQTAAQRYSTWRLCAWAGPVFLVGYVLTWGVLGFNVPPANPSQALADLYAHYVDDSVRIRLAFAGSVFFIPFYYVFSSVVSRLMQKIDGPDSPLSLVEQMGGGLTTVVGMVAGVCWMTAAYRVEERAPGTVRLLHDFGWMFFDTTYMVTGLQMVAMAIVFLSDRRVVPLIPRALCWYTLAVAAAFLPLSLLPFFYDGAFAWSGAFCYWVSLGSWFVWLTVLSVCTLKAINRLEREESGSPELAHATSPAGQPAGKLSWS